MKSRSDSNILDTKQLQTLSNIYSVDLIKTGTEINQELLVSLIDDIMKDGHHSANAADYLLETEYLSTTQQLHDNWLAYRHTKYPSFHSKIAESIAVSQPFDINNCLECDVRDYSAQCMEFGAGIWVFLSLLIKTHFIGR